MHSLNGDAATGPHHPPSDPLTPPRGAPFAQVSTDDLDGPDPADITLVRLEAVAARIEAAVSALALLPAYLEAVAALVNRVEVIAAMWASAGEYDMEAATNPTDTTPDATPEEGEPR